GLVLVRWSDGSGKSPGTHGLVGDDPSLLRTCCAAPRDTLSDLPLHSPADATPRHAGRPRHARLPGGRSIRSAIPSARAAPSLRKTCAAREDGLILTRLRAPSDNKNCPGGKSCEVLRA